MMKRRDRKALSACGDADHPGMNVTRGNEPDSVEESRHDCVRFADRDAGLRSGHPRWRLRQIPGTGTEDNAGHGAHTFPSGFPVRQMAGNSLLEARVTHCPGRAAGNRHGRNACRVISQAAAFPFFQPPHLGNHTGCSVARPLVEWWHVKSSPETLSAVRCWQCPPRRFRRLAVSARILRKWQPGSISRTKIVQAGRELE